MVDWFDNDLAEARISLNSIDGQIYARGRLPWNPTESTRLWTHIDDAAALMFYQEREPHATDKDIAHALSITSAERRFNPFAERLRSLPEPDGTDAGTVFSYCLHVDLGKDLYTAEACDLVFRGLVARAFAPATKFDFLTVLCGRQGIGKSTFLKLLALNEDWFSDSVDPLHDEEKDIEQALRGKWVAEIAELSAAKAGSKTELIKRLVSRTNYTARRLFTQRNEIWPRTACLFVTSNADGIPYDPTGNRRYLPIQCHGDGPGINYDPDEARRLIELAYAKYVQEWDLFQAGVEDAAFDLTLPTHPRFLEEANAAREEATAQDPVADAVRQYLLEVRARGSGSDGVPPRVCTRSIAEEGLGWSKEFVARNRVEVDRIAQIVESMPDWKRLSRQRVDGYGVQSRLWEYVGPVAVRAARAGRAS